jgi:pimeloyl-ACP methyl ester carboxylesterase
MAWLPGAYHGAEDFVSAGFAEAVHRRQAALDLIFVDLQLSHVGDRSVLERLRSDIVLPARAAGVSLWLGGISLGGLFALDYAATFAHELAGLCLLAPYLGNRILTGEIARAPGLAAWQPGELAETDEERRIWRYIQRRGVATPGVATPGVATLPLHLGYGRADRFAAAHALLAATLPADCVDVIDGAHDWPTWLRLWENFLDLRFA